MSLQEIAPNVLLQTSDVYMTNTTLVIAGARCLLIDPALLPGELGALEAELAARHLSVEAAVSTHPHWDHVLWSAGLGDAPRYASARAIETLGHRRAELIDHELEAVGGRWYARWDQSLAARLTPIPADGRVPWSGPATHLITHDGHAPGHSAVHVPELGVLAAGDMLSDIEVPAIDWDSPEPIDAYRHGLDLLAGLDPVYLVIPGHGHIGDRDAWRQRIDADRRYLDALVSGQAVDDARLHSWPPQNQQHQANLDALKKRR